jgi:hypothetical protein
MWLKMKYENEPINEELEAECWHEGIIANYKKLTREQALVLCGEKMIENLLKFWRRELFPNCLLKNMAASDEEIRKMLGSDNNDADDKGKKCEGDKAEKYEKGTDGCSVQHEDTQSSLNNCKGVMKMEANIQAKLDNYLELLNALKAKTLNELTAVYILQEISKDVRSEQIREEREAKNSEPATEKQKKFMKKLGMDFPKNATKQEASVMIDEELSRNGNGE